MRRFSFLLAASFVLPSVARAACGDGTIDAGETCDDTNTTAGDGCDTSCLVETGWECVY